jgi:RNA polymerase sigma factor (sigma-70 family)
VPIFANPQITAERSSSREMIFCGHEIFWQIWTVHHEYLFGLSLRLMRGNRADAEDALSVAKLKAMRYLGAHDPDLLNVRAWLSRLLYNVCMDLYRRRGNGEESGVADFDRMIEVAQAEKPMRSPEHGLLERELYRQIESLLDELPPNWRNAFIERFLREESYEEIARRAGTTEANIRKRIQLARTFLRDRLAARGLGREKRKSGRPRRLCSQNR